ncbi:MAG: hypothetical protein A3D17_13665 [Bdellovibrionales bacterium RIFCSPHIGHO2_02_FULL_40_15]|nr:MAG: hypothetical protein A3D17_13665 [Bdellovibrionales bacterium RIFCSPHIGHO2_02_FULL_40_15]
MRSPVKSLVITRLLTIPLLTILINTELLALESRTTLASETTHRSGLVFQSDNRLDQKFNWPIDEIKYAPTPYFGAHLIRIDATNSQYDDTKNGFHIGLELEFVTHLHLRLEQRFQSQTMGEQSKNNSESRVGLFYYDLGSFTALSLDPQWVWEVYAESFYIPQIDSTSPSTTGWGRAIYRADETFLRTSVYLEGAFAANPTADFGETYQEIRPGLQFQKSLFSTSVQLQVYKNILGTRNQDIQALLAIYGEWR